MIQLYPIRNKKYQKQSRPIQNEVRQVPVKFARPSEDRQPGPSSPGPSNSEKLQQYSSMEP